MKKRLKEIILNDKFPLCLALTAALIGAGIGVLCAWIFGATFLWYMAAMAAGEILGAGLGVYLSWILQHKVEED